MEDIMQMQQEAARRVRRMQEHSRRVFEQHRDGFAPPSHPAAPPLYVPAPTADAGAVFDRAAAMPRPAPPAVLPERPADTLRAAPTPAPAAPAPDAEQWLLIGLAILLFRSGSRPELIAALLYLAM